MSVTDPRETAYQLLGSHKYSELIELITPYSVNRESWAQAIMGQCYRAGLGIDVDLSTAKHFFSLSAAQDDPQGQLLFGHHLLSEGHYEQGRAYLTRAFEAGLLAAASYIAGSFLVNKPIPGSQDFSNALCWLEEAAEAGDLDATHQMGWMLEQSGKQDDLSQALSWYIKAADQGSPESAYNAGIAYERGKGTDKDFETARRYYAIAADKGIPGALHNLGALHYNGRGGPKDKEAAFQCYNAAAAQGSFLSSECISKMFAEGEIREMEPNAAMELAWLLIAEQQANELEHIEPSILARRKELQSTLSQNEKRNVVSILEVLGESRPRWIADILVRQYESGECTDVDHERASEWRAHTENADPIEDNKKTALKTDRNLADIPDLTSKFVHWLPKLGLDQQQIHGLFVLVGLYAGSPKSQEEMDGLMGVLDVVLPNDRSSIIDHLVGDFFEEYQLPLEEFCFRSGLGFEFRPIKVIEGMEPTHLLNLRDHGLLDAEINGIHTLTDASRLFQTLISALGESTHRQERSLKEAYLAGVYQMQHMAQVDHGGAQQLRHFISTTQPLVIGHAFTAITRNTLNDSLEYEVEQVALVELMAPMQQTYARQMWAFQSSLLFYDQQRISGVHDLDPQDWHRWVTDRARAFSDHYPTQLVSFSTSGITLEGVPAWGQGINDFPCCDEFIFSVWGLSGSALQNSIELLEYKALMVHVVYSSLTLSREQIQ